MARAGYRFFLKIKKKKKGERKKKREVKATWQTCGIIPIPVVRSQNSRAQTQG
jgi:hypothetical protein